MAKKRRKHLNEIRKMSKICIQNNYLSTLSESQLPTTTHPWVICTLQCESALYPKTQRYFVFLEKKITNSKGKNNDVKKTNRDTRKHKDAKLSHNITVAPRHKQTPYPSRGGGAFETYTIRHYHDEKPHLTTHNTDPPFSSPNQPRHEKIKQNPQNWQPKIKRENQVLLQGEITTQLTIPSKPVIYGILLLLL